jgi:hypothetical protein
MCGNSGESKKLAELGAPSCPTHQTGTVNVPLRHRQLCR